MTTEVRVPTLGESVTEATVATWFKKPGDAVAADEMLCELETDKVTVEVPAPAGGVLGEIVANEGDTVGVDALLAMINEAGAAAAPAAAPAAPAPAAGATDVMVPTLGESVTEAARAAIQSGVVMSWSPRSAPKPASSSSTAGAPSSRMAR